MADETDVITLNYDTFVEAAVDYAIVGQTREHQRYYDVPLRPDLIPRQPTGIIDGGNAWTGAHRPTLSLWKLHGSIRWYWDELTHSAESMVDVGQFLRWNYPCEQPAAEGRAPGKVPVIVPPATSKSGFFGNGIIRQILRGAFNALRRADRVFVVGYSLPSADLLLRSLLSEALQVHPEVCQYRRGDH